jgi:phosphoadenosine phosphosulfate reductase
LSATIPDLEGATAQEVLAYGVEQFHPRLTLACSFQKEQFEARFPHVAIRVMDARSPGAPWTAQNCCSAAKVAGLEAALSDVDAWITGIRREQATTRAAAPKLDRDERRGIWKLNPLADWTEKDVWTYIFKHDLPYNPLHDQGYASIGCAPCTQPGEGRDGRWAGTDKTECGIHVV